MRVDFGSDGSDLILRAGQRRLMPATNSAAALIENSPGFTVNGAPGVKSTRVWVWDDQRDTRDPPGPEAGLITALGCARHGGGGSVQRGIAGMRAFALLGLEMGANRGCARARC